jgi:hypothetical protein
VIGLDGHAASAPARVALALDCALGRLCQLVGAFAADEDAPAAAGMAVSS